MLSGQSFSQANDDMKNESAQHVIELFHGLQVAIMLTVTGNIVQYAYWTVLSKRRNVEGHWNKFQPVYLLILAAILVNVQPLMILIIGSFHPSGDECKAHPQEWPCTNCFWDSKATNSFFPNRVQGWLIQIFCTYLGYILLIAGVFQATDMVAKMRRQWRQARGR